MPPSNPSTGTQIRADTFSNAIIIVDFSGSKKLPLDAVSLEDPRKQAKRLQRKLGLGTEYTDEVEGALRELVQRRWLDTDGGGGTSQEETNGSITIDQCLGLLYGDDKDKAAGFLASLCHTENNLALIAENEQLLSALARLLREECSASTDLLFNVGKVFLAIGHFADMHKKLASHCIGGLVMDALVLESKRARSGRSLNSSSMSIDQRDDDTTSTTTTSSISSENSHRFTSKQEKIVGICVAILDNLADDVQVRRKMLKKGLMEPLLGSLLSCQSKESALRFLVLLRKCCLFEEVVLDLARQNSKGIAAVIGLATTVENRVIQDQALHILFNMSFNQECREAMVEQGLVLTLSAMSAMSRKDTPLRLVALRLLYHLSADESSRPHFADGTCLPTLVKLVGQTPPQECIPQEMAALLINLSNNPLCAKELIGHLRGFTIARLEDINDLLLAKIVRNLALWTYHLQCKIQEVVTTSSVKALAGFVKEPTKYVRSAPLSVIDGEENPGYSSLYHERNFWDLSKILAACVNCTNQDYILIELLATIGNMTTNDVPTGTDWTSLLDEFPLIPLLSKILASQGLEVGNVAVAKVEAAIIVCRTVCSDERAASLLSQNKIPAMIAAILSKQDVSDEVILQALCTIHRLLFHQDCRNNILSEDFVECIFSWLSSQCMQVHHCAIKCLDAIVGLDQSKEDGTAGHYANLARELRFVYFLSIR